MRRRLLALGIGLGALLAFPATGVARTIDVFPGDSIQHAVHKARAGDVIKVHQGIYHGSVEITKNGLTLKGSGIDRNKGSLIKPAEPSSPRSAAGRARRDLHPAPQPGEPQGPHQGHRDRGLPDPGVQGLRRDAHRALSAPPSITTSSSTTTAYGAAAFGSIRTKFLHNLAVGGGEAGFYVGDSPKSRAILRGNRARDNGQFGFFLRDSSHGRAMRNEAVHNCLGIGLLNTGASGGVLNWRIRNNEADSNNHFCKAAGRRPADFRHGHRRPRRKEDRRQEQLGAEQPAIAARRAVCGRHRRGFDEAARRERRIQEPDPGEPRPEEQAGGHRLGRPGQRQQVPEEPVRHVAAEWALSLGRSAASTASLRPGRELRP